MRDCHGTSNSGLFIHKSAYRCGPGTSNVGITATSGLWSSFVRFDFLSFAGHASFTQHSYRWTYLWIGKDLGSRKGLRVLIEDGMVQEEQDGGFLPNRIEWPRKIFGHNTFLAHEIKNWALASMVLRLINRMWRLSSCVAASRVCRCKNLDRWKWSRVLAHNDNQGDPRLLYDTSVTLSGKHFT
jgi:hypothetical protein